MISITMIVVIAALIMWVRLSATRKPIKGDGFKILLPILYISIGFSEFFQRGTNISIGVVEVSVSLLLGLVLSIPLIMTTNYEVRDDGMIYAKKSMMFVVCLLVILAIRVGLRGVLHGYDSSSMLGMFFLVAFGYVVPWRIASFVKFRRVYRKVSTQSASAGVAG